MDLDARRTRVAVAAAFAAQGLGFSVLLTHLPAFKDKYHVGDGKVTAVVFGVAVLASVFAHQYRKHIIVPIVAYTLAGTVVGARVSARRHFPGDVVAGAALGWFIGDYVFAKRHNTDLDHKKTISQKIMDHVNFGFGF